MKIVIETRFGSRAAAADTAETNVTKIARAMSAGLPEIARLAKIIGKDGKGHTVVLEEVSNGFTCMPGNPNVIGDPPMCAEQSIEWAAGFAAHKPKPTNTVPGITYMLAGATQRARFRPV